MKPSEQVTIYCGGITFRDLVQQTAIPKAVKDIVLRYIDGMDSPLGGDSLTDDEGFSGEFLDTVASCVATCLDSTIHLVVNLRNAATDRVSQNEPLAAELQNLADAIAAAP